MEESRYKRAVDMLKQAMFKLQQVVTETANLRYRSHTKIQDMLGQAAEDWAQNFMDVDPEVLRDIRGIIERRGVILS
jgi:hypothetical protein